MKNFVQPANIVDLTAPSGGIVSGQGHLFGSLFGVATTSAEAGAKVAISLEGVFLLPKATGASLAEGAEVNWTGEEVSAATEDDQVIGHVITAASADAATVNIRIKN